MNLKCKLTTDELIELAETGKVRNIVLDSMAKVVLHECLYMLKFEKRYYEKGKNKNGKQIQVQSVGYRGRQICQ